MRGDLRGFGLRAATRHLDDVADRASSRGIDTYDLAAYAGTQQAVGVPSGAAYSWHDIAANRSIVSRV